ncbi:MAG TPA: DNA polymerase III subunit delta [Pyrinomonadaceae bacterium]|nr:DNA polymerase III subunit delta [Pyrinomonadaceae bacterium]
MILTRASLREQLRRREIAPVYTFFGEETYLRDAAVKYLADICFGEGELREFNEVEFRLNTSEDLVAALASAEQLPMMAQRRVVLVRDVRVAHTSNRDTLKEEDLDVLAAYLERPSPSSVVVFVADELNAVRKAGKLLRNKTVAVEFDKLKTDELRRWAEGQFQERGSRVDGQTVAYLLARAGDDLRRLQLEIAKLTAASLPSGEINRDLIDLLVPHSAEISNFALTDQLMSGRHRDALVTLRKLFDDGIEPLALLGLISSNYRRLILASQMFLDGATPDDVIGSAKAYGPSQKEFLAAARRRPPRGFEKTISRIAKTDVAIKNSIAGSGNTAGRIQLEMLVCELALSEDR